MLGKEYAVYVNTGTVSSPTFIKVGGQRGGTLNRAAGTIDVASKDNDGWEDEDYGLNNWGIDFDGLIPENDIAYELLESAWYNQQIVKVRWEASTGAQWEGEAIITEFPEEAPYDDSATYSISLKGKGKPTQVPAA